MIVKIKVKAQQQGAIPLQAQRQGAIPLQVPPPQILGECVDQAEEAAKKAAEAAKKAEEIAKKAEEIVPDNFVTQIIEEPKGTLKIKRVDGTVQTITFVKSVNGLLTDENGNILLPFPINIKVLGDSQV